MFFLFTCGKERLIVVFDACRAPEIQSNQFSQLEQSEYTSAVDIWAVGCCFYELLLLKEHNIVILNSKYQVFINTVNQNNFAMAIKDQKNAFFKHFEEEMKAKMDLESASFCLSLLQSMLAVDPERRPTANELCKTIAKYTTKKGKSVISTTKKEDLNNNLNAIDD